MTPSFETHFNRPCSDERGSGPVCPGFGGSRSRSALTGILEHQEDFPLGSNPPWRVWVYRLAPEAPLFKRMLTGSEAFLEPPGASGLRPCARTHLKMPSVTPICWMGRSINTGSLRVRVFEKVGNPFSRLKLYFGVYDYSVVKKVFLNHKKVGNRSREQPEGYLFKSYYTEALGRAIFLSLDCST